MKSQRHEADVRSVYGELFCDFDAVEGPEVAISLQSYVEGEIDWGPGHPERSIVPTSYEKY